MKINQQILLIVNLCLGIVCIAILAVKVNAIQATCDELELRPIQTIIEKPVTVPQAVTVPERAKPSTCQPLYRGFYDRPGIIRRIVERRKAGYGIHLFRRGYGFHPFRLFRCR